MRRFLVSLAFVAFLAGPVLAGQDHSSHSGMAEGVHTKGKLNAIDGQNVNVSHEAIPEIGWPAMTMDMKLLDGAKADGVTPGDAVQIMLEKGPDGMYGIRALMPDE